MAAAAAGIVLASSVEVMGFSTPAVLTPTCLITASALRRLACSAEVNFDHPLPYVLAEEKKAWEQNIINIASADIPEGFQLAEVTGRWERKRPECGEDTKNIWIYSAVAIAEPKA